MNHSRASMPRRFLILVLVLGVVLLVCGLSFTQEKSESGDKIRELKQQRLALLEKVQKMTAEVHQQSPEIMSLDQVRQSALDVLTARLDLAETREDRIKVCEDTVKDAVDWEAFVAQQLKNGQIIPVDAMKAQAHVLAAQISLEKERTSR